MSNSTALVPSRNEAPWKQPTIRRLRVLSSSVDDTSTAAVFLITPLGLRTPWISSREAWIRAQDQLYKRHDQSSFLFDRSNFLVDNDILTCGLQPLLEDIRGFNGELLKGFTFVQTEGGPVLAADATLAKAAFHTELPTRSSLVTNFIHYHMRAIQADWLISAFSDCIPNTPRRNVRANQEPRLKFNSSKPFEFSPRLQQSCDQISDWRAVVESFLKSWRTYSDSKNSSAHIQDVPDPNHKLVNFNLDKEVREKIARKMETHSSSSDVHAALFNLCSAGMGIFATLAVCSVQFIVVTSYLSINVILTRHSI
jgi:hypothetical protein